MAKRAAREGDPKEKDKDEPIRMYYWKTRDHEGVSETYFEAVGKAAVWTLQESGTARRSLRLS